MSDAPTDPFLDFEAELKSLLDLTAGLQERLRQQGSAIESLTAVRESVEETGAGLILAAKAMEDAGRALEPISTDEIVKAMDAASSRIEALGDKSVEGAKQGFAVLADEVKLQLQGVATGFEGTAASVLDRLHAAETEVASARSGLGEAASGLRAVAEESAGRWSSALEEIRQLGSASETQARDLTQLVELSREESVALKPLLSEGLSALAGRLDELGDRVTEWEQRLGAQIGAVDTRCAEVAARQEDSGQALRRLVEEIGATRADVAVIGKRALMACVLGGMAAGLAGAVLLMRLIGGG